MKNNIREKFTINELEVYKIFNLHMSNFSPIWPSRDLSILDFLST